MKLSMTMRMGQRLIMTPAMQQAIKLLPLTKMELVANIRQELDENPFLEEVVEEEAETESNDTQNTETKDDRFEEEAVVSEKTEDKKAEEPDWEAFLQEEAYSGGTGEGYAERPSIENTLRSEESLQDHLIWQLNITVLDPVLNGIGLFIIGELDDDGFLKESIEDIAEATGGTAEQVREVLETIKSKFEPTGVGAGDIRESLLLQAKALEPDDPIIRELIEGHLMNLSERHYAKIAKLLKVDAERIIEAVEFIRALDPSPGKSFNPQRANYVEPDIYIVKVDDEWQVHLNDEGVPMLKINNYYRSVLKKNGVGAKDSKEREFIEQKVQSAIWLVKSIEQRRQTMLKVGRSLAKFQKGFLDKGLSHLKPLVLKDVANDIEMHESTISRVTRNKYIHTPQGIFELKFFFHSGVSSYLGNTVSSVRVKEMIKKIVMEEDSKSPATDDKIVGLLQTRDVKIARRTVTKYRKELGIPSGSKRKKIY